MLYRDLMISNIIKEAQERLRQEGCSLDGKDWARSMTIRMLAGMVADHRAAPGTHHRRMIDAGSDRHGLPPEWWQE